LQLKSIADELEDLFGIQPNDLALDAMSAMIENTLSEIHNKHIEPIKNLNTTTSLRFYRRRIAVDLFISNLKI
jgi:predicted membrane chloride channel (bestrophin family)